MKNFFPLNFRIILFAFLACSVISLSAVAQCSVAGAPTYSSSCSAEYYTVMNASGISVVSTISLTGGTCSGSTYFNKYATQGITVTPGNTVHINFTRYTTTYTGYMTVYVDWNNNGTYETTELAGTMLTMPSSVLTTTCNFLVPTTGVTTGVNLHMRVMLSELTTGAPCTANYGQTYDYYLQANGCIPATTINVTPPSGSVCIGGAGASFTANGAGTGGSYIWSPTSGLSASTGATIIATPTISTVYTVTGTTTSGCSGTTTASVTVNPSPSAAITASGPLNLCAGDSVVLSTPSVSGITYQWYLGATSLSGATNHNYTALAPGTYTVKVTNSTGCSAVSVAMIVTVSAAVSVSDTVSGPITFCSGDSVKLKATTGAGFSYQWISGGVNITGATNSQFTATSGGTYTCSITLPSGCNSVTAGVNVTVNTLPVPVITFDGKLFHTGNTYTSYQWYENNIIIPGAITDTVRAQSNGYYTVKVTDSNGCSASAFAFHLTNVGVNNVNTTSPVSLFPNPATSILYFVPQANVNAVILSPDGKKLMQQQNVTSIDISNLPCGIYLIELFDEQGYRLLIQKLIKN